MTHTLHDELEHCRRMVSVTNNALAPYVQELELYGKLTDADLEQKAKLERQRDLWMQLAAELDTYLNQDEPEDVEQDLFSEAGTA